MKLARFICILVTPVIDRFLLWGEIDFAAVYKEKEMDLFPIRDKTDEIFTNTERYVYCKGNIESGRP